MNLSQLISMAAIAPVLALSAGCQSIDIPPASSPGSPDPPGLSFEPSGNATLDAYDLILYDRIERKWRASFDALTSTSRDYSPGRVKVTFRLHENGHITDLKIVQRTVGYRQTALCWEAVRRINDLPAWPREARRFVQREDYRDLTFIFYYSSPYTRLVRFFSATELYDRELITAIQKKWYSYLDAFQIPLQHGLVVVEFILHRDGTVTDAQVTKSSVSERLAELCRQAVFFAGPFPGWPDVMQGHNGKDYRKVRFRFYFEE